MAPDQPTPTTSHFLFGVDLARDQDITKLAWFADSTWNSYGTYTSKDVYDAITGEYVTVEEAAALANGRACRCRDLSVLYRDELPRSIQIRKPVLCRFQPAWSPRRWRSVT